MKAYKTFGQKRWLAARGRVGGWTPSSWKSLNENRKPAALLAVFQEAEKPMRSPELAEAMVQRDPEIFQPWHEDAPQATAATIFADRNLMEQRFREYIRELKKHNVPIVTTKNGYAINWNHVNAESITVRAMATALREQALMVTFDLKDRRSEITLRLPGKARVPAQELYKEDVADILDWMSDATEKVQDYGPMNFHGSLHFDGDTVAIASLRHLNGIAITLHVGMKSIHEHDLYLADRARILSEFYDRKGDDEPAWERGKSFSNVLINYFNDHNDLSSFSLDEFAEAQGFDLAPAPVLSLRYSRSVDIETLNRLKHTNEGYTSREYHSTREAVVLEMAIELRSKESTGSALADAAEALINEIHERKKQQQESSVERDRIAAGIGQDAFDGIAFRKLVDSLAELAWELGGYRRPAELSPIFDTFEQAAAMLPTANPLDAKDEFEYAISTLVVANEDNPFSRIIIGRLLNHAENDFVPSRRTSREKAVDQCREILQAAYHDIKDAIFSPRARPIIESEGDDVLATTSNGIEVPLEKLDGRIAEVTLQTEEGEYIVHGRLLVSGDDVEIASVWGFTKYVHQVSASQISNIVDIDSESRDVDAAGYERIDDAWNRFAAILEAVHACEDVTVHRSDRDDEVRIIRPLRFEGVLEFWGSLGLRAGVVWWVGNDSKSLCEMSLEDAIKTVLDTDEPA
jgi:hypothetical protein